VRWQHLVVRPLYDEFAGFAEFQAVGADITDRKAAEDELAAEKERLASDARQHRRRGDHHGHRRQNPSCQ